MSFKLTLSPFLTSVIAAAVMGIPSLSSAAVSGTAQEASADLIFQAPAQISHTLTATRSLTAGENQGGTILANGLINLVSGQADGAVITFPNETEMEGGFIATEVSGKANPDNKLKLILMANNEAITEAGGTFGVTHDFAMYSDFNQGKVMYDVITPPGVVQEIAADTYSVSVVAYAYNN